MRRRRAVIFLPQRIHPVTKTIGINLHMIARTGGVNVKGPHAAHSLTRPLRPLQRNHIVRTGPLCAVAGHRPGIIDVLVCPRHARRNDLFAAGVFKHHLAVVT